MRGALPLPTRRNPETEHPARNHGHDEARSRGAVGRTRQSVDRRQPRAERFECPCRKPWSKATAKLLKSLPLRFGQTARDAEMYELAKRYPQYGFDRHKGYGTAQHLPRETIRRIA